MSRVVIGYTHWGADSCCPYCKCDYIMVADDGREDSYLARCWCGATARCHKDDPDLLAKLAAAGVGEAAK